MLQRNEPGTRSLLFLFGDDDDEKGMQSRRISGH